MRPFRAVADDFHVERVDLAGGEQKRFDAFPVRQPAHEERARPRRPARANGCTCHRGRRAIPNHGDPLVRHAPAFDQPAQVFARHHDVARGVHPALSFSQVGRELRVARAVSLKVVDRKVREPPVPRRFPDRVADDLQHEGAAHDLVDFRDVALQAVDEDQPVPRHLECEAEADLDLVALAACQAHSPDGERPVLVSGVAPLARRAHHRDFVIPLRQRVRQAIDERGRAANLGREDVRDEQYFGHALIANRREKGWRGRLPRQFRQDGGDVFRVGIEVVMADDQPSQVR